MLIWEYGMILIAASVVLAAFGYNLTLGGYSRRRLLEGESVSMQIDNRLRLGNDIMRMSLMLAAAFVVIFSVISVVNPVDTKEAIPEKVDILVAQNKTVMIIDGTQYSFDASRHHIKRVYYTEFTNSFGFVFWRTLRTEYKDQWEITGQ